MNTLITGTFPAEQQAAEAVRQLIKSCVPLENVRTILPGMRLNLARHQADGGHAPKEPGSIMVAVKAPQYVQQRLAEKILREHGARDIECVNAERRSKPRMQIRIPAGQQPAAFV